MPYKEKEPEKLFYTIGEVSKLFKVNTSLIRFWEKEFDILKPKKNKKGNRLFTKEDLDNLHIIYHLVKERGFKLGCCSNSMKETLHIMLKSAHLFDFFDLILGNDQVKNPKPHPEIYLTACKALRVKPQECIVVEDSVHGIASAKASGAVVYPVRGTGDVNLSLFKNL